MRQKISNTQISRTIESLNKLRDTDMKSLASDTGYSIYYIKSTVDALVRLELVYRYGNRIIVTEDIPNLTFGELKNLKPKEGYHKDRLELVKGTKDAEIIRGIHIMGHLYLIHLDKDRITIEEYAKLTNTAKSSAKMMFDLLVRAGYMENEGKESYTFIKEIPVVSHLFNFIQDLRIKYPYQTRKKPIKEVDKIDKPKIKEKEVKIKKEKEIDLSWIDNYANSFESITSQYEHILLLNALRSAAVCI